MIRTLLVSALFAIALTACGKKEEAAAPAATAPAPAATAPAAAPADAAPATGTTPAAEPKPEEKK
jgi:hypothetical protein